MIKTISLIFLACILFAQYSFGDVVEFIDSALIRVRYDKTMLKDTVDRNALAKTFEVTLYAGNKGTAFYSAELRADDESPHDVAWVEHNFGPDSWNRKTVANMDGEKVFRIYDKNKSIEHFNYELTNWDLVEEIEKPIWEIQDSTQNILGFECIKAMTDFRGRRWIAWFAPEIPISEGPWKLFGLPGIILKAYDSKKHYSFEAREIDTQNPGLVEFNDYSAYRLSLRNRKKALMNRRKWLYSDTNKVARSRYGKLIPDTPSYNKDTKYDFLETDYEHVPIESYKN